MCTFDLLLFEVNIVSFDVLFAIVGGFFVVIRFLVIIRFFSYYTYTFLILWKINLNYKFWWISIWNDFWGYYSFSVDIFYEIQ